MIQDAVSVAIGFLVFFSVVFFSLFKSKVLFFNPADQVNNAYQQAHLKVNLGKLSIDFTLKGFSDESVRFCLKAHPSVLL